MDVLIVDGYNIIGAWDELTALKETDIGQARDVLIEMLAEYQAYTGDRVIAVFDAHFVPGSESRFKAFDVEIIYTKENETADECIERLVTKVKNIVNQVYVATSDFTEQRVIFGRGALRKSARELYIEYEGIASEITKKIERHSTKKPQTKITIDQDVLDVFEKWRRGNR